MSIFHKSKDGADVHTSFRWFWANAAARSVQTVTAQDLYKFGIQLDTFSVWMLTSDTPTWQRVDAGTGASGGASSLLHFLVNQAEGSLPNSVNLGALYTGMLRVAVSGGVATPYIASPGSDYAPAPDGTSLDIAAGRTEIKPISGQTLMGVYGGGSAVPGGLTVGQVRALLGLLVGNTVQAYSTVLDAVAAVMSSTATAAAQRSALGANVYDIAAFVAGKPSASQICCLFVATRSVVLPQNLTGSYVKAGTAATSTANFDIQVNGVSKGTISFAASGTSATFTFANAVTLAAGDILKIIAPSGQDATLADVAANLAGTY